MTPAIWPLPVIQAAALFLIVDISVVVECSFRWKILPFFSFQISQVTRMTSDLAAFLEISKVVVMASYQFFTVDVFFHCSG